MVFPFFAPEGHRIVAGGETIGTGGNGNSRPGRTPDQSSGLSPFQGWKGLGAYLPVVSPRANIRQRLWRGITFFVRKIAIIDLLSSILDPRSSICVRLSYLRWMVYMNVRVLALIGRKSSIPSLNC